MSIHKVKAHVIEIPHSPPRVERANEAVAAKAAVEAAAATTKVREATKTCEEAQLAAEVAIVEDEAQRLREPLHAAAPSRRRPPSPDRGGAEGEVPASARGTAYEAQYVALANAPSPASEVQARSVNGGVDTSPLSTASFNLRT